MQKYLCSNVIEWLAGINIAKKALYAHFQNYYRGI